MNMFLIYLIVLLDHFDLAFTILMIIPTVFFVIYVVERHCALEAYLDENEKKEIKNRIGKSLTKCVYMFIIFFILDVFLPTTKEMAFIYVTPKIINNSDMRGLPNNLAKTLNKLTEQYINNTLIKGKKQLIV
jgi:hypothetical protein